MFGARIILDSVSPMGARLTTFEMVMPRIVLAEFNTHRMFSRNSASSRAIPVEKMIAKVIDDPFVPTYWGKNQKGMQADEELSEAVQGLAKAEWLGARNEMVIRSKSLLDLGVHKQLTNRLLEPFLWHTVVFTATELDNYRALRDSSKAQPEIAIPTRMLFELYDASKPTALLPGQWHLPFVTRYEDEGLMGDLAAANGPLFWPRVSAARCARTSYLTHEGKRDFGADTKLYESLAESGHMSPLEHPAKALSSITWEIESVRQMKAWIADRIPCGNFWGWQQLRKLIPFEHNFAARAGQ